MNYFSYDPEDGFELHATEEEAKKRAESLSEDYADTAHLDGRYEEVEQICWGKLSQEIVKVNERKADEGSQFDSIYDYELKEVQDGGP